MDSNMSTNDAVICYPSLYKSNEGNCSVMADSLKGININCSFPSQCSNQPLLKMDTSSDNKFDLNDYSNSSIDFSNLNHNNSPVVRRVSHSSLDKHEKMNSKFNLSDISDTENLSFDQLLTGYDIKRDDNNSASLIWATHPQLGYAPAIIIDKTKDDDYVVKTQYDDIIIVKKEDATPVHPSCLEGIDDLLVLGDFDMGPLLHNIRVRYFANKIYTSVGPTILLSVNPYHQISHLYSNEVANRYRSEGNINQVTSDDIEVHVAQVNSCLSELPPHIFRLAEAALFNLYSSRTNQSIIISGESGAGKTEATKIILNYLASTNKEYCPYSRVHDAIHIPQKNSHADSISIEMKLTQSNPILESFGNAKTIRNDNSSRFGKFTQINFDINKKSHIVGAQICNYLLEKSRIVKQQKYERNYHVFYQLCEGRDYLDSNLADKLALSDSSNFFYLCRCVHLDGREDRHDFRELLNCFESLGFQQEQIDQIFGLLAGILHLGNVHISSDSLPVSDVDLSSCDNPSSFLKSAELFGLPPNTLLELLLFKTIPDVITQKKIVLHRSEDDILYARDALCKSIYERLFQWLVNQINLQLNSDSQFSNNNKYIKDTEILNHVKKLSSLRDPNRKYGSQSKVLSLNKPSSPFGSIGLLDIFGFEIFDINSFEQLCINFANEQLQQHFNSQVLREEQILYEKEHIDWTHIPFEDNQKILDALTHKTLGVFPTLDSECLMPRATDQTFLSKILQYASDSDILIKPSALKQHTQFGIIHYAGPVFYDVDGMLEKNRDRVHTDIFECFNNHGISLLRELFSDHFPHSIMTSLNQMKLRPYKSYGDGESLKNSNLINPSNFANSTVSYAFRAQLTGLMEVLEITSASYIRCIKPNSGKEYHNFDAIDIIRQLKCAGMLESIRIRKAGYSIRLNFIAFLTRYRALLRLSELNKIGNIVFQKEDVLKKKACELLQRVSKNFVSSTPNESLWVLGRTKIFLKEKFQTLLESMENALSNYYATKIASAWKMYDCSKKYNELRHITCYLQSLVFSQCWRNEFEIHVLLPRITASSTIQKFWLLRMDNLLWKKKLIACVGIVKFLRVCVLKKKISLLASRYKSKKYITPHEWSSGYVSLQFPYKTTKQSNYIFHKRTPSMRSDRSFTEYNSQKNMSNPSSIDDSYNSGRAISFSRMGSYGKSSITTNKTKTPMVSTFHLLQQRDQDLSFILDEKRLLEKKLQIEADSHQDHINKVKLEYNDSRCKLENKIGILEHALQEDKLIIELLKEEQKDMEYMILKYSECLRFQLDTLQAVQKERDDLKLLLEKYQNNDSIKSPREINTTGIQDNSNLTLTYSKNKNKNEMDKLSTENERLKEQLQRSNDQVYRLKDLNNVMSVNMSESYDSIKQSHILHTNRDDIFKQFDETRIALESKTRQYDDLEQLLNQMKLNFDSEKEKYNEDIEELHNHIVTLKKEINIEKSKERDYINYKQKTNKHIEKLQDEISQLRHETKYLNKDKQHLQCNLHVLECRLKELDFQNQLDRVDICDSTQKKACDIVALLCERFNSGLYRTKKKEVILDEFESYIIELGHILGRFTMFDVNPNYHASNTQDQYTSQNRGLVTSRKTLFVKGFQNSNTNNGSFTARSSRKLDSSQWNNKNTDNYSLNTTRYRLDRESTEPNYSLNTTRYRLDRESTDPNYSKKLVTLPIKELSSSNRSNMIHPEYNYRTDYVPKTARDTGRQPIMNVHLYNSPNKKHKEQRRSLIVTGKPRYDINSHEYM